MHGRDDEVAGLGGVNRYFGGLLVADFTEADDVRILAQGVAQQLGKGDVGLVVDLHLTDVLHDMFDRILDGDDVFERIVDRLEQGVERSGLAAPGGAADQDHAGGHPDRVLHDLEILSGQAGVAQRDRAGAGCEHPDGDLLAAECSDAGDAERCRPLRAFRAESAILRTPLFGDVHTRGHLDCADHAGTEVDVHLFDQPERAVHPEPDREGPVRLRIEEDVAGAP